MIRNMGRWDRIGRVGLVVLIGVLWATGLISGTWAIVLGALAVVFVATSVVGTCPLYIPFGISTRRSGPKPAA